MKTYTHHFAMLLAAILIALISCQSGSSPGESNNETGSKTSNELVRLEKFLGIPVYPTAEIANFYTFDRSDDDEIPNRLQDASVSLIIDDYEKVPPFYEEKLGGKFLVDINGEKKYYTMIYKKDGWQYEIYVGNDTYMNKPIFSITGFKADD